MPLRPSPQWLSPLAPLLSPRGVGSATAHFHCLGGQLEAEHGLGEACGHTRHHEGHTEATCSVDVKASRHPRSGSGERPYLLPWSVLSFPSRELMSVVTLTATCWPVCGPAGAAVRASSLHLPVSHSSREGTGRSHGEQSVLFRSLS